MGLTEVSEVGVEAEAVGEVVVGTLEAKTMASEDVEDPEEDVGVLPAKVASPSFQLELLRCRGLL